MLHVEVVPVANIRSDADFLLKCPVPLYLIILFLSKLLDRHMLLNPFTQEIIPMIFDGFDSIMLGYLICFICFLNPYNPFIVYSDWRDHSIKLSWVYQQVKHDFLCLLSFVMVLHQANQRQEMATFHFPTHIYFRSTAWHCPSVNTLYRQWTAPLQSLKVSLLYKMLKVMLNSDKGGM